MEMKPNLTHPIYFLEECRFQNRTWNGSMKSVNPSSVLCCLTRKVTKMKAHDKERQRKSIEKAMKRKDDDAQEEMSSVSFSFFK